jgi:hypothetical protein
VKPTLLNGLFDRSHLYKLFKGLFETEKNFALYYQLHSSEIESISKEVLNAVSLESDVAGFPMPSFISSLSIEAQCPICLEFMPFSDTEKASCSKHHFWSK